MAQIFDYINDILFFKKKDLSEEVDGDSTYSNYMVNRWSSMYSPQMADLINLTANRYYSIFNTKSSHYNFLCNFLPRSKQYRIEYIKKTKSKPEDMDFVKHLSKYLELSEREIRYYIETHQIDTTKYKKLWTH